MRELQLNTDSSMTKEAFYPDLKDEIKAIVEGQRYWVTNLANASAVIYHGLRLLEHFQKKPINWVGFYIVNPQDANKLILGPFQGKVACTEIAFGKGVCGTGAATRQTQVIKDVHQFPGHIACDSASKSEIVVPMIYNDKVIGVLDIDCEETEGFDETDRIGLEAIVSILIDSCEWPY
ncbi:hypothetical protein VTP01DRAFT_4326 [Rhizomucor pusillus]|uniref:uncharacterized protein n=1 Tax=Rhizomucor pusillus TaxID=4840 RepID=UPI0037437C94